MASKTYYVSTGGLVKRLDNLTGSWTNVSVPLSIPAYTGPLLDVETDPNDFSKVFVVGEPSGGVPGILVSSDAGVTWTTPGGTIATQFPLFNEVSVVDSNFAFICGNNSTVAKTINGGATFDFITSIPPASSYTDPAINSRPAKSLHFITQNVGVVGTVDRVWKTTNGGNTWTQPIAGALPIVVGGTNPGSIVGIHISADQQTIVFVGESDTNFLGGVYVSTNGGSSYTKALTFSGQGTHLTWINDNELWAFGTNEECYKTSDGGITWLPITSYNASVNAYTTRGAHFFTSTKGFFGKSSQLGFEIDFTTDAGITGSISDTNARVNAVWTGYRPDCYKLTNCNDATQSFTVTNDLSDFIGGVIKVCPEDLPVDPTAPIGGTPVPIQANDPGSSSLRLTNCCNPNDIKWISNNSIASYAGGNYAIIIPSLGINTCYTVDKITNPSATFVDLTGAVYFNNCTNCTNNNPCEFDVPNITECTCFEIELAENCAGAITLTNIGETFGNCTECGGTCYQLTDCSDEFNIKIVTDNLSAYVDQVIEIPGCPGICWFVTEAINCIGAVPLGQTFTAYPDCATCLPPVVPTPPVELKIRQVVPGYKAKVCSVEYEEKVNCKLADALYNETKKLRYGIQSCCEGDLEKWKIKKQLLDYAIINTPNPVKQCFCYTIEWISGTTEFKYIDCAGTCQSVTVSSTSNIAYVCSQNYPRLTCQTNVGQYTITGGVDLCTSNTSCAPPPCTCYSIINNNKVDAIISFTDCETGQITEKTLLYKIPNYFCINGNVTILFAEDPQLVSIENLGTNCTGTSDCVPCNCYSLTNIRKESISYQDCNNNFFTQSLQPGTSYLCAIVDTIVPEDFAAVQIVNLGNCSDNQDCAASCFCYLIDNLAGLEDSPYSYISCESGSVSSGTVLAGQELSICAKQGSVVILSGDASLSVGDPCQTNVDCQPPAL